MRAFFRGWLTLAAITIWGLLLPALDPAFAATEAGSVLAMRGQCFVIAGSQQTPLKLNDTVDVGDVAYAPVGAKLKLLMVDGSVISVGSGTKLAIQAYGFDKSSQHRSVVMALAGGLLRAVVAKVAAPSVFEVTTATGVAAVRSTDWFIENKGDSTRVGVLRGVVMLSGAATGRSVRIPARWGSHVAAGKDPVPARLWTTAEFADVIGRTDLN